MKDIVLKLTAQNRPHWGPGFSPTIWEEESEVEESVQKGQEDHFKAQLLSSYMENEQEAETQSAEGLGEIQLCCVEGLISNLFIPWARAIWRNNPGGPESTVLGHC